MRTAATSSRVGTRVRHLVPARIRRAAVRFVSARRAAEVEHELAALARDARPIAVGPWLGEVGFELLYWVPFVRWFAERYHLDPTRVIAVTRGGAAAWYAPFAGHAVDALVFMTPDAFRTKNAQRNRQLGEQKQIAVTALDKEILEIVRRERQHDVAVLHPSLMYWLFAPYWWGHQPMDWVRRRAEYRRLEPPRLDVALPSDYTAVKFYFNDAFPDTAENRAFVGRTVAALQREGPVVSLSSGISVDDHLTCDVDASGAGSSDPAVMALRGTGDRVTPETNLLVQSAIVSRARRFVGTYGGFAYLAPFYGVAAETYYSKPDGFSRRHLDLVGEVLGQIRGGALSARPVADR